MSLQLISAAENQCSGSNFPQVALRMEIYQNNDGSGYSLTGNYSTLYGKLMLVRRGTGGTSTFNANNNASASAVADGTTRFASGGIGYDFRSSSGMGSPGATKVLWEGYFTVGHASNGTKTLSYSGSWDSVSGDILGDTSVSGSVALPTIPKSPTAPTVSTFEQDNMTEATLTWSAPSSNGGAAITGYRITYAYNSSFTSATNLDVGTGTSYKLTGLTPGATVYAKVAAKNAWTTANSTVSPYSSTATLQLIAGVGNLDGWAAFGSNSALTPLVGAGLRRGPVSQVPGEDGLHFEFTANASGSFTAGGIGFERTFTGLTIGTTYRFDVQGILTRSTSAPLFRLAVTGIGAASSTTLTTTAGAMSQYQFVATSTSHVLRVENRNATSFSSGDFAMSAAFYNLTLTEVPDPSPVRLQDVAYEGPLSTHFDYACASVGAEWWPGKDGVVRFRQAKDTPPPVVEFSDVAGLSVLNYTDIGHGYDTKNTVNVLSWTNHGRDASTGNTADIDGTTTDTASVAEYGVRPGSIDMSIRSGYVDLTNLAFNPRAGAATTGWAGSNATISRLTGLTIPGLPGVTTAIRGTMSAATGGLYHQGDSNSPYIAMQAGKQYRVTAWLRASVAKTVTPSVQFNNGSSNIGSVNGANVSLPANTWTNVSWVVTAPAGAVRGGPYWYSTTAWASGNTIDATGLTVTEGTDEVEFFDGDTPDANDYLYEWTGTANASSSVRRNFTDLNARLADVLDDFSTPDKLVTWLTWNAQQNTVQAAQFELQDRITVTRRGTSGTYRIIGISHELDGLRWMQKLTLAKEAQ